MENKETKPTIVAEDKKEEPKKEDSTTKTEK